MSEQVSLHNTREDYEALDASILAAHKAVHSDEPYARQTTKWAEPTQRTDGKWTAPVCPHYDYSGITVVDYNPADYPTEEE